MLFDLLAVFAVTLISSFVFSTTSVHGYPSSASNHLHYIPHSPAADLSSSLRLVPSTEGGDGFAPMFDDDDDTAESPTLRSRKLFLLFKQLEQEDKHRKRSSSTSTQSTKNAALAAALASSMHGGNRINLNHASDSIRLSPALKNLVKDNPILQTWLTMLLQKLLEDKSAPYIFKYGRRRK